MTRTNSETPFHETGPCPDGLPNELPQPQAQPPETWPYYAPDEIAAATRVLESGLVNYWTGQECRRFEEEFAAYHRRTHGVALANGTLALEAALLALDVGPGDEVVVPPRTFVATAGAVVLRGARPVFADVDPESGNVTAQTVEAVLTARTRAIIVVHLGGWSCEMDTLIDLARSKGIALIEDCAQSHGATYRGQPTGSFGDAAAFSFCQDKIITTGGEGGMLITDSEEVWLRAWSAKDHGKSWTAVYETGAEAVLPSAPAPTFRWLHHSFGSNWRLTEVQAAIGRVQLRKLDDWVARRRQLAGLLAEGLGDLSALRVPRPPSYVAPSYYRFYAYVRPEALRSGWSRDRILAEFAREGIPAMVGSCSEVYLERAFVERALQPAERLPVARQLGETSIAFPTHPTLQECTVAGWVEVARSVLERATG